MGSVCILSAVLFSSLMADDMSLIECYDALFLAVLGYSWSHRPQGEGLRRCFFTWLVLRRGRWGPSGDRGKEQGEVLMGKRQMACQCQKWSCAEESAEANEREDGRKGWLINLFTSLKMLQAPFWLKFRLPSIITNAGLSYWSCQHQMLWKPPPPALSGLSITPRKIEPNTLSLGFILIYIFISSSCFFCRASGSLEKCFCISRSLLQRRTLATPGF